MKISEVVANSKIVDIEGVITNITTGNSIHNVPFVEGILSDDSGQIRITIWGLVVESIKEGTKLKIVTGWCKEFDGKLQITNGKFGKVVLDKGGR